MYFFAYVTVAGLVYIVWTSELKEYAQGIITLILGRFLGYLDGMYGFEFGTTRSGKQKDETLQELAKNAQPPTEVK
jgi:hypothetical protein